MPDLRSGSCAGRTVTAEVRNTPAEERCQPPNSNPNSRTQVGTARVGEIAAALAQPEARENHIGLEEGEGDNNEVGLAIAEKKMDEFGSGGKSGDNRLAGGEDEGTAPLPETVRSFFCYFFCNFYFNVYFIKGVTNKQKVVASSTCGYCY